MHLRRPTLFALVAASFALDEAADCKGHDTLALEDESDFNVQLLQSQLTLQHTESWDEPDYNLPPYRSEDFRCDDGHDDQNWLFILASGRSGSTSTLQMVNAIPGYAIGGENFGIMDYFRNLRDRLHAQVLHVAMQEAAFVTHGTLSRRSILCDLQAYTRHTIGEPRMQASTIGFKEVRHSKKEELDPFLTLFPRAKFIINTRNASTQAQSGFHKKEHDSIDELEQMNNDLRAWAQTHSDVTFDLRLEDFSVKRFNEMLHWLGITNCRFTRVAHANDGGYTNHDDKSVPPGIECW
jgi:hypothetical protein